MADGFRPCATTLTVRTRDRRLVGFDRLLKEVCDRLREGGLEVAAPVAREVVLAARHRVQRQVDGDAARLARRVRDDLRQRGVLLTASQVRSVLAAYCLVLVDIDWVEVTEFRSVPAGRG